MKEIESVITGTINTTVLVSDDYKQMLDHEFSCFLSEAAAMIHFCETKQLVFRKKRQKEKKEMDGWMD